MPDTLKTSLIILISQLPLAAGGWLWWTDKVQVRPLYALLIGGGYEVSLFAAAFVKKVWKEELEKDAVKVTADWVRGFVRDASGFRRRYREHVVNEHGVFNVRGLGLINTYTLKLERVFVELRIDPSGNPRRLNPDPVARRELAGNRPVWDFLRPGSGVREGEALAVIGPPGCGKTTLLQHVAVTLAANRQYRHRVRAYVPVLLFLREHARKITGEQPPSLGQLVGDHFGDRRLFPTLKAPPDWFGRRLERGKCILLLDGLDEVADADERRRVSAWVDAQITNYPRCRFVLTARPQGYADAPLQRAHVLEVQPFNAGQVRRFVEGWYLANEIVASGHRDDAGVRLRARKDAQDLLRRLQALPSLSALTVNPLLLTMIAMVHRYHGALPGSRVELYAEICEVLLGRWRQSRGIHDPLKTGQKLVVLWPLAAHMMAHRKRDITTAEALGVMAGPLERVGSAGAAAERFLSDLQAGSGLLLEREAGQWSFAHLTFQEYLTAAHWLEEKRSDLDWHELVGDSWWHETLRLYAAQGDATPLVRACLEVDTVPALTLAADFLEEARELLPAVRRDAERRLVEDLEAEDPARRRLTAEVQLSRRLGRLRHLDERREIDPGFITCAEYQLFLDDMRAKGKYHQPDHWDGDRFAAGCARQPVAGVRAEDAAAFCKWLTQKQGGGSLYRLPTPAEAGASQPENATLAAWCFDDGIYSLTGLTPAREQEIRRQLSSLSEIPLPPDLSRALSHARDLDLSRALDRALSRALDLAFDLAFDLPLALDLSRARAFDLSRDLSLDRVLELDRALADVFNATFARDYKLNNQHHRALILLLALACVRARFLVLTSNTDGARPGWRFAGARCRLQDLSAGQNVTQRRWAVLLDELLAVADATTRGGALLAQRKYATRLLEYAYLHDRVVRETRVAWLRRRLFRKDSFWEPDLSLLWQKLYWWFRIVVARAESGLPAWEGIRIVREQVELEKAEVRESSPAGAAIPPPLRRARKGLGRG